jgi:hypothetical protein
MKEPLKVLINTRLQLGVHWEYERFFKVYGLEWRDEETVETVSSQFARPAPLVKTRGQ